MQLHSGRSRGCGMDCPDRREPWTQSPGFWLQSPYTATPKPIISTSGSCCWHSQNPTVRNAHDAQHLHDSHVLRAYKGVFFFKFLLARGMSARSLYGIEKFPFRYLGPPLHMLVRMMNRTYRKAEDRHLVCVYPNRLRPPWRPYSMLQFLLRFVVRGPFARMCRMRS